MIGSGYVGLVTGACFADLGNKVWWVDKDITKVNKLKKQLKNHKWYLYALERQQKKVQI